MRFRAQWKRDVAVAKKPQPWRVILGVMVGGALLCLLLDHFAGPDLVLPGIVTLASLPYIMWLKWTLRRELWFRVVMVIFLAVHGILFVSIPWTYRDMPGRAVGGACALDICLMLVVVDAVGVIVAGKRKVATRRGSPNVEAQEGEGAKRLI